MPFPSWDFIPFGIISFKKNCDMQEHNANKYRYFMFNLL